MYILLNRFAEYVVLENNNNGQMILPFKLMVPQLKKDLPTTPSKRSRTQSSPNDDGCDDDDAQ